MAVEPLIIIIIIIIIMTVSGAICKLTFPSISEI
jgi:hypothetical protein